MFIIKSYSKWNTFQHSFSESGKKIAFQSACLLCEDIGGLQVKGHLVTQRKDIAQTKFCKHPIPMAIHQSPSVYWGFKDIRIFCLIVFFYLINTKALEL